MKKMLIKIKYYILGLLYEHYKDELLERVEAAYNQELNDHSKAIIFYIQEKMEEGHSINIIVSKEMAESEFGIMVDKTGEGSYTIEDITSALKDAKDEKKVH